MVAFFAELFSAAGFFGADRAREDRAPAFLALPVEGEDLFAALFLPEDFGAELFFVELFFAEDFLADDLRAVAFFPVAFFAEALEAELWRAEVFLELDFRPPLGFVAFRSPEVLGALDLRVGFFAGLMGAGR